MGIAGKSDVICKGKSLKANRSTGKGKIGYAAAAAATPKPGAFWEEQADIRQS